MQNNSRLGSAVNFEKNDSHIFLHLLGHQTQISAYQPFTYVLLLYSGHLLQNRFHNKPGPRNYVVFTARAHAVRTIRTIRATPAAIARATIRTKTQTAIQSTNRAMIYLARRSKIHNPNFIRKTHGRCGNPKQHTQVRLEMLNELQKLWGLRGH